MSKLETIFHNNSTITVNTFVGQRRVMTSDQFKSALTDVLKLLTKTDYIPEDSDVYSFSQQFKEKMNEKLEKLIG